VCVDRRSYGKFAASFEAEARLIFDEVLKAEAPSAWMETGSTFDNQQDAALMLTSGTTAYPRAVRVTHRNIQANTDSIIQYLDLTSQERILVVLPFYYCFGTSLLHTHLRVGGTVVICNTFAYPETALDLLDAAQCTGLAGVPSTYQTLLRNTTFAQRKLNSLRKIQQAGGKLQVVFIRELIQALPHAQIYVMYGQTEATARLSYLPPELLGTKIGSIGKGIPGVSLRVLDEAGQDVHPGEVGEIYAWGDNISPGYMNDPGASAEKFVNGALRTGDLATVDEDGFIYIVDRKADFIKSMGHRVSSQEIEARILEIPEVVAAAAIGEADELQGEAIKVFVTLKSGVSLAEEDVIDYCRRQMARHMVPKQVVVVDSLPMNAHGKVIKSALRSLVIKS
jgi:acyl-CoA synthetase (AMP-forming)/AMP-acid ligase II